MVKKIIGFLYKDGWKRKKNLDEWTENSFGTDGAFAISEVLETNSSLTSLSLECNAKLQKGWVFMIILLWTANYIDESGAAQIGQVLKYNCTLTSLNISRNEMKRKKREENEINDWQVTRLEN